MDNAQAFFLVTINLFSLLFSLNTQPEQASCRTSLPITATRLQIRAGHQADPNPGRKLIRFSAKNTML